MKKTLLLLLISITQLSFSQEVNFKIIEEKTVADEIGAITLYAEVINNTENDITILKPATKFRQKWRFYNCNIQCDNIPLWTTEAVDNYTEYYESDLLIVPKKSKEEIIINGRHNANMLVCEDEIFKLELTYDAGELIENIDNMNLNIYEKEIVKKLTPLTIKSKESKIKIHKNKEESRIE